VLIQGGNRGGGRVLECYYRADPGRGQTGVLQCYYQGETRTEGSLVLIQKGVTWKGVRFSSTDTKGYPKSG
jgi:hypothetical protein